MNWFMYVKENVRKKKWFCVMSPLMIFIKHVGKTLAKFTVELFGVKMTP
jgi:ribosomal protein S3AE